MRATRRPRSRLAGLAGWAGRLVLVVALAWGVLTLVGAAIYLTRGGP